MEKRFLIKQSTFKYICKGETTMTSLKTALYAALAATCLFPLGLAAQDLEEEGEALAPVYASEIEIGVGVNTEQNHKFGKFNGLEDDGAFFIGNIDVRKNRPAGDNSKDYWEINGTNLGLDSRSVYGEYTRENLFSIYADFDQRVNNLVDDGQTPYSGAGTERLTLPANWVPASGVGGLTELLPSLQNLTIEKDRKKYGVGASWNLSDLWQLSGNFHHEDKDGTDEFGAIFGSSGGNPRGATVPIPHDFDFDEFDVGIAYKGARGHFTLTYNYSSFDNNSTSLVFDNAFANGQWNPASSSAVGALVQGQVGNIFPDNDAWNVNFSGGWNWSSRTRMTVNATYGEMTQDEPFLPYTIIPALQATVTMPLPRANLNGEIDTTFLNVNLSHRFTNGFDARARFTYDDRDNNSPKDVYARIAGDAQTQAQGTHRYPRPYSYESTKFEFDASYRLPRMSKLSAGYKYQDIDRDYQEVDNTEEHSFHVKLSTMPVDWMSAWAKYTYASRDGGGNDDPFDFASVLAAASAAGIALDPNATNIRQYFGNAPFLEGEAPDEVDMLIAAFLANPTLGNLDFFENDPILRKSYMADRDRDAFTSNFTFYPNNEVQFSLYGRYSEDDYDNSPTGLQDVTRGSLTFDVVYAPSDRFSGHAFFTMEKNDYHQRGFESTGSQNKAVALADRLANYGNNFWQVYSEESVFTTGAGFEWEVIEDKFDLNMDLTYSDATTDIEPLAEDFAASTRLPAIIPFPDVETRIFRIQLMGDYKYKDGWGVRGYYWYERFHSTDFALDSIEVNTLAGGGTGGNVILLGNRSPQYNAHVIGFTLYHQF